MSSAAVDRLPGILGVRRIIGRGIGDGGLLFEASDRVSGVANGARRPRLFQSVARQVLWWQEVISGWWLAKRWVVVEKNYRDVRNNSVLCFVKLILTSIVYALIFVYFVLCKDCIIQLDCKSIVIINVILALCSYYLVIYYVTMIKCS